GTIRPVIGSLIIELYDVFKVGGDNLFATQDIAYHRVQKRLMANAYTPTALRELESMVYEEGVLRLVDRLYAHADAGETVDMMVLLKHMTFDIIGKVALGKSFKLLDTPSESIPIIEWINASTMLGMMFARNMVEQRRNSGRGAHKDTLQQLIDAVDEKTGSTMSNDDIVAQTIMLMVAGTETTAVTLVWALYFVTAYPEYARKLRAEIMATYPDPSTPLSYERIRSCAYLEAFLRESMRMRPIVCIGFLRRMPAHGITLGGHYIPEGCAVASSVIVMDFDERVFPSPDTFQPERWITTPEQLAVMKQHSLPFSMGVRACIARDLAWMELKLTLVQLLRRFTFTPSPDNDMTPIERFVLRPRKDQFLVQPHRI
ncbi:cytochrome P450, partial [Syncephalis pseudoplumigaleata]